MGEAADRYAAVNRAEWENYKQFGYPLEDKLIGMIDNQQTLDQNLQSAQGMASTLGATANSEILRNQKSYGVNPTAEQTVVNDRLNNLATTASMASARDYTRGAAIDRNRQILVGGAPNDGLQNV